VNVAAPPAPPRALLIVDDEEANRTLLKTFFGKKGFTVVEAADGPSALAIVDDEIDLVLLDMMMPDQSGLEVLRTLRARGRTVPVILLTAVNAVDTVVEVMQAGAQDYITKPFSLPVLLTRVERALRPPVEEVVVDDVIAADDLRIVIPRDGFSDDTPARVPPPTSSSSSLASLLPSTVPTASGSTLPQPSSSSSSSPPRASGLWSRLGAITRRILSGEQPGLEVGHPVGPLSPGRASWRRRLRHRLACPSHRARRRHGGEGAAQRRAAGAAARDGARVLSQGGRAGQSGEQPPRRPGDRLRPVPRGPRLARDGVSARRVPPGPPHPPRAPRAARGLRYRRRRLRGPLVGTPVPLPSAVRPGVEMADAMVQRMLAKDPGERPAASEAAAALRAIARHR